MFRVSAVSAEIAIIGCLVLSVSFRVTVTVSCMLAKVLGLCLIVTVLIVLSLRLVLVSIDLITGSMSLVRWCGVTLKVLISWLLWLLVTVLSSSVIE